MPIIRRLPMVARGARLGAQVRAILATCSVGCMRSADSGLLYASQIDSTADARQNTIGGQAGALLDASRDWTGNLVPTPDSLTLTPGGTSAPTVATTTFLGQPCISVAFNVSGAVSYAVANAVSAGISAAAYQAGDVLLIANQYALSRALVGTEMVQVYDQSNANTYGPGINSTFPANAWFTAADSMTLKPTAATPNVAIYASGTWSGGPVTVYVRQIVVRRRTGLNSQQATAANRPLLQSASGLKYLDFDGVNDTLASLAAVGLNGPGMYWAAAVKPTRAAGTQEIIFSNTRYTLFRHAGGETKFSVQGVGDLTAGATPTLVQNQPCVIGVEFDAGFGAKHRINGVNTARTTVASDSVTSETGFNTAALAGGSFFQGWWYADVLLKRATAFTEMEKKTIDRWLAAKSGVSL